MVKTIWKAHYYVARFLEYSFKTIPIPVMDALLIIAMVALGLGFFWAFFKSIDGFESI